MATKQAVRKTTDTRDSEPGIDWQQPPVTLEEHLKRIRLLSARIVDHVRFIKQVSRFKGASDEAKQRAVATFYARLNLMEQALGRIEDDLRLS